MDDKNHDKVFFQTFAIVLGALFSIFFICITAARMIDSAGEVYADEGAKARLEERIRPAGQVVTDPAALLQLASAGKVAREPYTGPQLVQKVCGACHGTGMLGAPKAGDKAAWTPRLKANGGIDGLVASAIKGKGSMPPRGGDADVSDAELKAAITELTK